MAELRPNGPYIYVTNLAKLLVGHDSCTWAHWFKAQHTSASWDKAPSSFDAAGWRVRHTAFLQVERERWEKRGYTVTTERQNSFFLSGSVATLGGVPDLIAWKDNQGIIIDVKTGAPRDFHPVQVQLYLYALPRADRRRYKGIRFSGLLAYTDHEVPVSLRSISAEFIENMVNTIRELADTDTPARRVPSRQECSYCDITSADCPERIEEDSAAAIVDQTSDF